MGFRFPLPTAPPEPPERADSYLYTARHEAIRAAAHLDEGNAREAHLSVMIAVAALDDALAALEREDDHS